MGLALLLSAVCCLPLGHSARLESDEPLSWLQKYEGEAKRRLRGPLVDFPQELESDYSVVRYLGTSSSGDYWLVTDQDEGSSMYNEQVVVKLLYLDEGVHPVHLTWRTAQGDRWLLQGAREAARECEIAAELRKQGKDGKGTGAVHVINCYGHNVPGSAEDASTWLDMPLFLVLESCGGEDLTNFMHKKAKVDELSVELVGRLFQQVLEGVDFLASLTDPWMHHNLKPDNIIVKSHEDGSYTIHFIDLGAAVKATQAFACGLTASTAIYAPSEWGIYKSQSRPHQNFQWSQSCPTCATAFDMFAASAILLELVTGSRLYHLSGAWGVARLAYASVNSYAKHPEQIHTDNILPGQVQEGTGGVYSKLMERFLKPGSNSAAFFNDAMSALCTDPSTRPTAATLLKHAFLTGIRRGNSAVVAPIGLCRFEEGEVVTLFNPDTQDYEQATVTAVRDDMIDLEKVEASEKTTCHSPRLRKLPGAQSVDPQGGYRPAVGSELPGYDEVTRMSTDSECPELCEECEHWLNLSPRQHICWSPTAYEEERGPQPWTTSTRTKRSPPSTAKLSRRSRRPASGGLSLATSAPHDPVR